MTLSSGDAREGSDHKRRAGWTVFDQILSSGTNAALSVVVARSVGAVEFGAFSIAFVVFSFMVGLSRAIATDPLIVRHSVSTADELREAGREATGTALLLGALGSALIGTLATILGGGVGPVLLALALVLPGLILQDAWRQMFFAAGRPQAAAANDAMWALLLVVTLSALHTADAATVPYMVLAWGAAASGAALFGAAQARCLPRPRSAACWIRHHRDLNSRLAASYVLNMGAVHLTYTLVGIIGGLVAVGGLRAAQVLLGPLQVLFPSLAAFALPLLARRVPHGASTMRTPALLVSSVASCTAAGWLLCLLAVPSDLGRELLGQSWEHAREVLPAVGIMMALIGGMAGASLVLKALALTRQFLVATLVEAPLILLFGCAGAYVAGASGAAAGLALAHAVGLTLRWNFAWRATRRVKRCRP